MPPIRVMIKPVSSLCNLRCRYCFYADVAEHREIRSYGVMEEETLEAIVRAAFDGASGSAGFVFQGGEPMLAGLDFYRTLLSLQKKYNTRKIRVENSIQTNGTLLTAEWAEFFAQNGFLVGLSIDGTREAHDALRVDGEGNGTYGRAVRAAELLKAAGAAFNVLCVVNNFVARYPQRVYQALKPYRYLQFIPCLDGLGGERKPFSLTEERYAAFLMQTFDLYYADYMRGDYVSIRNFDNYIQMLRGMPPESCAMSGVCSCSFVVESDGSVYPCDFYVLDAWRLGNVRSGGFREMQTSATATAFTEGSRALPEECRTCPVFFLCRGGCRREREPGGGGEPGGRPGRYRHCRSQQVFLSHCLTKMRQMAETLR